MKKVLMSLGIFFGLILAAIIIIPLVVNVDSYRPQLVEMVNQKINGRFELSRLKLSLWGQVRVDIEGLSLKDLKGHSLLEVKEAFIHLPLMPLISGDPLLTFKMVKPELSARKGKDGKINWLALMKPEAQTAAKTAGESKPADTAKTEAAPAGAQKPVELPAIALRARLGFEITESVLRYLDEATGFQTQIDDLRISLRDLSLSRPMQLEVDAGLNSSQGKTLKLSGKMSARGQAQALVEANQVKGIQASLVTDFTPVQVEMPGLFLKKAGVAARADMKLQASPELVQIDKFTLEFFNAKIDVFAKMVAGPKTEGAVAAPADVNFTVKSNDIDLAPWAEVLPPLQGYALGGKMKFQAQGHGKSDQLQYAADVSVQNMTAKAPHLKAAPVIQAQVVVSTDRIEKMSIDLKGPGNDLRVSGQMNSFTHPSITLKVDSTGMDLDQWIDFPKPAPVAASAKGEPAAGAGKAGEKSAATAPEVDLDASLDPLRKNEMAKAMSLVADVNMKFIQAQKVRVSDISGRMSLKNLDLAIDKFAFGIFGGRITNDFQLSMLPKTPTYKFGLQVSSLDLKQAVESSLGLMKNTLFGKLSTQVKGSGASFNTKTAKAKLEAQGNFKVENATFASVDVMKMTSEALNQALTKAGEKVPPLKGKTINMPKNAESRYESVSSDFKISQGRFVAPNFHAKAEPGKGIDLKGNTETGLLDQSLKAQWQVIDTQNMTKARDISIEQAGTKVEHVLCEGNNPITFPVTVGCTVMAPCYNYGEVPAHFATVAFNNVAGAATARAKAEVSKKVEEQIKKVVPQNVQDKIPPKVNDAVKDMKKKFGF